MNRIRIHVLPSSRGRVQPAARLQEQLTCAYVLRPCPQTRLEGHDFCIKHILEDKTAPYKQCSYVSSKNGKRCPNAAPKMDRRDGVAFCAEHARRNALALRAQMKKASSGPTAESLLSQLSVYQRPDACSEASRILDEDSVSEEEQNPLGLDQTWRGEADSEADSNDSEHEDPLKHAGVYTAEEVALITRDKLIRLQSLYIDQFKRLQHLLQEKKRRYLHQRRAEHDTLGSSLLTGTEGLSLKERENLKKLKALRRYRRRYGTEALLHRQLRERRQAVTDGTPQPFARSVTEKCVSFVDGGRCEKQCLPMTRHCLSHIHQDSSQVLFRLCPGLSDLPCDRTVHMGQSEEPRCPLHLPLPPALYQCDSQPPPPHATPPPTELYLSTAELQPSESLPLEFSDDLDVEGDGLQLPPSPLQFDTALALEDHAIRAIAEAPMDFLTADATDDLEASGLNVDAIMDDQVVSEVMRAEEEATDSPR